ncbi:hypothetical protein C2845_PM07G05950 [Panicum miliaceum]|uniref:RNase H type-1 domain-containing protein n=1 Tax=Panicum miliaceum TaxID=4540 RepID=A0A3L6SN20_PANMI|nr:hypothetical protein C2845_PM07G05950 [Panicum miliaceum]
MEQKVQYKVFVFLWRWWSARNKANAGEKNVCPSEICNSVAFYLMEFDKLFNPTQPVTRSENQKWKPPYADHYKVNVDASFNPETKKGGWGFIARDCDGRFLEGGAAGGRHAPATRRQARRREPATVRPAQQGRSSRPEGAAGRSRDSHDDSTFDKQNPRIPNPDFPIQLAVLSKIHEPTPFPYL